MGYWSSFPIRSYTVYIYTLRDILCSGPADLFTSWFIFIVVICHWPDGLVSEAHIINHGGHYCSIITLSLSEPATFPACVLSISVHNTNTHTRSRDVVSCKVCSTQQSRSAWSKLLKYYIPVCIQGIIRGVISSYKMQMAISVLTTSVKTDRKSCFNSSCVGVD